MSVIYPSKRSNAFNDYFSTIAKSLSDNIPNPSNTYVCSPSTLIKNTCYSFFLKPATEEQTIYHLRNLTLQNLWHARHSLKLIKPASVLLAPVLTKLFNIAIEQATFPTIFKTAEIVPVHKTGFKVNCSNYRPMFLLCFSSKLLENYLWSAVSLSEKKN